MMRRHLAYALAAALVAALTISPSTTLAAQGDCSQPLSTGANPTASDCLFILQVAVSITTCASLGHDPCVCAPKGTLPTSATDALVCLNKATQQPIELLCPCGGPTSTVSTTTSTSTTSTSSTSLPGNLGVQCSSAEFFAVAGSDLDSGFNGLGHNQDLIEGASISLAVVKRCSDTDTPCVTADDCNPGATCDLTCACDGADTECEVSGPTHERRCLRNLEVCSTNADCPGSETCEHFFGPPLPLTAANTPVCITTLFASDIVGTADSATGTGSASSFLRSRVHLGIAQSRPCPRCGNVGDNPEVGDMFTCNGGPDNGNACTVDATSPEFGGVSFDCAPDPAQNVSGQGLAIRFKTVTTGSVEEQAQIPCAFPLSNQHPSTGNAFCLDDFSESCNTNADCMRCTDDFSKCTSNGDCSPGASCATAPDQPVPCGIYCHCGYCGDDPDQPCFSDADCDAPDTCVPGSGSGGGQGPIQQERPNACDTLICGEKGAEECCTGAGCIGNDPTPETGECSIATFKDCQTNADCNPGEGVCNTFPKPCFEHVISRTGTPDPLKQQCVDQNGTPACTTNADCTVGECVDVSRPISVGLFCIPPTSSDSINAAGGIPGPGAIRFNAELIVGRCGDGRVLGGEECDDGNLANGDGCNESCMNE